MSLWGVFGIVAGVVAGGLAAGLVAFNVQRLRLGRVAAALAPATRRQILALIDQAGAEDGTPVLLLRADPACDDPSGKVGGDPALPPGASWPRDGAGEPARFLAQVRLHAPPLPEVWARRHVTLFAHTDEVVARCDAGVPAAPAPAPPGTPRAAEVRLGELRLPRVGAAPDAVERPAPYEPAFLCRRVPGLAELLAPHGERLLPYILVPGIGTYEIGSHLVSVIGGEPELIQGEHDARCAACGEAMRFLLHVGDVLDLGGDAPIVYVYGCDRHNEQVAAFVDFH